MPERHNIQFDLNKALGDLKDGKPLNGKGSLLAPLIKQLTKAALQAEQEVHLAESEESNRKNGYFKKTVKTASVQPLILAISAFQTPHQ